MIYRYCLLLAIALASPLLQAQPHPRGLVNPEEVPTLRERVKREPYTSFLQALIRETESQSAVLNTPEEKVGPERYGVLAANTAAIYLFTGEQQWADQSRQYMEFVLADSLYFNTPLSRGLNRATLLYRASVAYDFCYAAWPEAFRERVNEAIYRVAFSVNASMGRNANYPIDSNWMGIRFATVLFATMVYDQPAHIKPDHWGDARPLEWDATKRVQEHIAKNTFRNGWNGESIGYFGYDWSFVGPALLALQKRWGKDRSAISTLAPHVENALWGLAPAVVTIEGENGKGLKPDLSDDGIGGNPFFLHAMGFALFPESQHPYLRWVHDYLVPTHAIPASNGQILYSLLYYRDDIAPQNPAQAGWLNYHDPDQGIALYRNRFADSLDIVAAHTATATRVRGHNGPDTNTFRFLGLGVPWIIGGGRTGEIAGQTNLFVKQPQPKDEGNREEGKLLDYQFDGKGGGYSLAEGSCMGVEGHRRFFRVDFDAITGAAATWVLADRSVNGEVLRLVTPEFNQLTWEEGGFLLTAPNGATLRIRYISGLSGEPQTGLVRYGGSTERLNFGIGYQGKRYNNSRFIDLPCKGDIAIVATLQPTNTPHPVVKPNAKKGWVMVGAKKLEIK